MFMKYHLFRLEISSEMWRLTLSILLFKWGLSSLFGICPIMTTFLSRLRATLSIICEISFLHWSIVWCSILLVPAARTVTSLEGMPWILALICHAVCPGYTKPVTLKESLCTSGATPRTMELPTTVTEVGCCEGSETPVLGGACPDDGGWPCDVTLARAAKRLLVWILGTGTSPTGSTWPGNRGAFSSACAEMIQIMAWRLFSAKPLFKPMTGYCQSDPEEHT